MATFNKTIVASSDDARQAPSSSPVIDATVLTSTSVGGYNGFRFTNVTIPQGSTVSAATITLTFPSAAYDDPDVDIYCEDRDDTSTFTTGANNLSSRPATTATTTWTATGIGTGAKTSPDFAAAVEEVVQRAGWVSGNSLVVMLYNRSTAAFRVNTYDGGGADYATLNVTYTAPSGGAVPLMAMHYSRQRR